MHGMKPIKSTDKPQSTAPHCTLPSFLAYEHIMLPSGRINLIGNSVSSQRHPVDKNSFLYIFSQQLFSSQKEYPMKVLGSSWQYSNPVVTLNCFNHIIDKFIDLHTKPDGDFLDKHRWIDDQAPAADLISNTAADLNYRHPYAQKLDIAPDSHIVVFGDMHGSIHSYVRNLWRLVEMGFLDEQLQITDSKGYMILLGDLVDRGRYSVEVLFLSMLLKLNNPDKVFIIRGNHEDPNIGTLGGLYTIRHELISKYDKQPDLVNSTIKKLSCFYDLLPFKLLVVCNKNYKIVDHAGIDPSYNFAKLLLDPHATYQCLKDQADSSPFLCNITREKALEYFRTHELMPFGNESRFYCVGSNWCDFSCFANSTGTILHDSSVITFSGHGYAISLEVFDKYMRALNQDLAHSGMTCSGIIRAHQHTSNALTLFDHTRNVAEGQAVDWKTLISIPEITSSKGFCMDIRYPIFTLMSAPEGIGNDNSHGIPVNFNKDAFCIITTGETNKDWYIKPFEFDIPSRNEQGLYCSIAHAQGADPICTHYSLTPCSSPVSYMEHKQPFSLVDDLESEVDYLFKKLQQELNVQPKSYKPDVPLTSSPLIYPIAPSLKTSSLNHIRFLTKNDTITQENLLHLLGGNNAYLSIVENALSNEILNSDDYYVFYHAHRGSLECLHDIFKLLYSWGFVRQDQPLPLRFVTQEKYIGDLNTFLNFTRNITKNSQGFYQYRLPDGTAAHTAWFDHIPEIQLHLIATNNALFGNKTVKGESTFFDYFVGGQSMHVVNIRPILEHIFLRLQIPEFFLDKIMQATNHYIAHSEHCGKLLQFFIKKEIVDEVAYWSFAGGKPVNQQIFNNFWDPRKQRHTRISPFLGLFQKQPMTLNNLISTIHHTCVADRYDLSLDAWQTRIFLGSAHLYNPEKTKVLRYGVDMTHYNDYIVSLNSIFEEIIRHLIRHQLTGDISPFQHGNTPLKVLDEIISGYVLQKNRFAARKKINSYHLDHHNTAKTSAPEDRFLLQARRFDHKSVHGTHATQLKGLLPLCKKLPGGTTPLIHAVKTCNQRLIQMLCRLSTDLHTDIDLFEKDSSGKTALDWCQIIPQIGLCDLLRTACSNRYIDTMLSADNAPYYITNITELVPERLPDVMEAIRRLNCAAKAYVLVQEIIHKTDDIHVARLGMDLAETFVEHEDPSSAENQRHATNLAYIIVNKFESSEITRSAIAIAEKLTLQGFPHYAYYLIKSMLDRQANPSAIKTGSNTITTNQQDIMHKGIDIAQQLVLLNHIQEGATLATLVLSQKTDQETLDCVSEKALSITEALFDSGNDLQAHRLALKIMERQPKHELLTKAIYWAAETF